MQGANEHTYRAIPCVRATHCTRQPSQLCVVAIVLAMSLADARRGDDRAAAPEKESNVDDIVSQGELGLD